jgi:hypothetical protein
MLPRVLAENVEIVRSWLDALSAAPDAVPAIAAEFWDADADVA